MPTRYGGKLELPSEPIGEGLFEYFDQFEEDFQGIIFVSSLNKCIENKTWRLLIKLFFLISENSKQGYPAKT